MINLVEYLDKARSEQNRITQEIASVDGEIKNLTDETVRLAKIKKILSQVAIHGRDTVKRSIETIVTDGLHLVYGSTMKFEIHDIVHHSKPGANFKIKHGKESSNMFCFGGGIRNIVSTILRFIFAEFSMPKMTVPLVLDEVGNNLSLAYQDKFGELLATLSRKFNRQVILISHQPTVIRYADQKIKVVNKNGRSEIDTTFSQNDSINGER